ncbi:MAG: sugar ABC transporter permease [Acutalibacteraceae bacterium]|nr:sugar ABC transporter permease [Acutalibacteraceae bacterium]
MTFTEYKALPPAQKVVYKLKEFFSLLPGRLKAIFSAIGEFFKNLGKTIAKGCKDFFFRLANGDGATKISYIVMGFGNFTRGQTGKGLAFLAAEILYIIYMANFGLAYLNKFDTLGTVETHQEIGANGRPISIPGDNSMLILLYGTLTILITIVVFFVYVANTKAAYECELRNKAGKRNPTFKEELSEFLDGKYHVTMLSLPVLLISIFTILPLIFMILIAFTNYDKDHVAPGHLFTWVGMQTFRDVFKISEGANKGYTFVELAKWTIIWAIFATFTNYIGGMILALMINKKSIKFKTLWRTLFVITIAVPQFVTLLLMNQILQDDGVVNIILGYLGIPAISFFNGSKLTARITVIVINMWIGVPYTILQTTGILMNIPEDLYESARIDGATPVVQFFEITLPYMLFVTTPYLIQSFVGNINNFNVIYLLTKGAPNKDANLYQAGQTDILVTWLFKLTLDNNDYNTAAAVGILVFIVCATLSLITFNLSKSSRNEEEFS